MAKKIQAYIKLQVKAGEANPSPPVGPALARPAQLEADPRRSGVLFAVPSNNFYPCGTLIRTTDGGAHWTSTGTPLDVIHRIASAADRPRRLGLTGVVCSCSRSCEGANLVAESTDGGRTWSTFDLPGDELVFAWSPRHAGVALVATSSGLFRRSAPDETWQQVDDDGTFLDLVAGRNALYALRGQDVRAWISTDDGDTWKPFGPAFDAGDPPSRLEVRPGKPDRVLARTTTSILELGESADE